METGELTTEQGVNLMKAARKDTSKKLLGDIKNKIAREQRIKDAKKMENTL